jgi:hypothetical protein
MHDRQRRNWSALAFTLAAACHSSDAPLEPNGAIEPGQSLSVTGARTVHLDPGANGGNYTVVLVNTAQDPATIESYSISGAGISPPTSPLAAVEPATLSRIAIAPNGSGDTPLSRDDAFEDRLRTSERAELTPRMSAARDWFAARHVTTPVTSTGPFAIARSNQSIPANVKVGDTVIVNVNGTVACTSPIYHRARVAAIGTHSIVLADTTNPSGGFTDPDYQRYAARFDTLVYPLDVAAFGDPTDIDNNGRIALVFTSEVNKQTAPNSTVFVGGYTYSRDLFPIVGTSRAQACAASNEGEYFYLMTPDPLGVYGNRRTTGFVDSNTTAVIAHEFQHLINASRRLYVNNTPDFEVKWLDEGLAHIAEELLFYHESGLSPRSNLSFSDLQASPQRSGAFNLDVRGGGNYTRYASYLQRPSKSSPYAKNDSLHTRGATWSLLRYLADQSGPSDGTIFFRLANGPSTGLDNLRNVFGELFPGKVRDWATSHAVDDIATEPALQQPSWVWRSIYAGYSGSFPLQFVTMGAGQAYSGTVIGGGAAFYRLGVPAGATADVTLSGQSASAGSNIQFVIVRTR